MARMPIAVTAREVPAQGRVERRPVHHWNVRHQPYVIQPICIAPVLPGETLNNALFQCRAVTQPVRNRLIGWWLEHYWFYIKHRDLAEREELVQMALDPEWTMANIDEDAASVDYYHYGYTINWSKLCLRRVVEEFFRDEGEEWDDYLLDGMPISSINSKSWLDSVYDATLMPTSDIETGGENTEVSELDQAYRQWEFMRANSLTTMSYEDFLRTYGVRPDKEVHRPEMIRFSREWTYPVNTVNPANGTPTTAVSWSISERMDKKRFFSEPGFIFGVTVARPKVYLGNQKGSAVGMLKDAYAWLPALLSNDPYTSLRMFDKDDAAGRGPINGATNDYWVDVRDLFLYGDQFINYALTLDMANNPNLLALPTPGLQRRYAAEAQIDDFFVGDAGGYVEQDGVVNLNIAGKQVDYTGTMVSAS